MIFIKKFLQWTKKFRKTSILTTTTDGLYFIHKDYSAHLCSNLDELRDLGTVDASEHENSSVDWHLWRKWWGRFPYGLYIIKKGQEIIGGCGIWPVSERSYHLLRKGTITEKSIHVLKMHNHDTSDYWYFSGIVIQPAYRRHRDVWKLIKDVMQYEHNKKARPHYVVTVGAVPMSTKGRNMASRFLLHPVVPAEKRKEPYPFYERKLMFEGKYFTEESRIFPQKLLQNHILT